VAGPDAAHPGVGQLWRRAAALAAAASLLAVADSGLAASAGAFDNVGRPATVSFSARPSAGADASITEGAPNDWARPYFGADSSWRRYTLRPTSPGGYTVWLDSIETSDVAALRAHPIVSCYRFHHFSMPVRQLVTLSSGIVAQRIVYTRPDGAQWHTLAWEWPVAGVAGGAVRHERIVLFGSSLRAVQLGVPEVTRAAGVPIRETLLGLLDQRKPDADTNTSLTAALVTRANVLISLHVHPKEGTA
jgi:hypothetical protein